MTKKENVMLYELIEVESNGEFMYCSDLKIRNNKTGEVVIADCVKVWDEDQYSLAYMFHLVKQGKWSEGVLDEADEIALQQEVGYVEEDDE